MPSSLRGWQNANRSCPRWFWTRHALAVSRLPARNGAFEDRRLTHKQLTQKHFPLELTLEGLLFHLALVEEDWTEVRFAGLPEREPWAGVDWKADPNWESHTAALLESAQLQSRYRKPLVH